MLQLFSFATQLPYKHYSRLFNMLYSNLVLLATATSVLASPVQSDTTITLPLKRLNQVNSVEELFKQGKARISRAKDIANAPLENAAVSYLVNVTVGAGNYQLILDTGCKHPTAPVYLPIEANYDIKHLSHGSVLERLTNLAQTAKIPAMRFPNTTELVISMARNT